MNSRERVALALRHQEPDRVPLDLGGSPVTGRQVTTVYRLYVPALASPPSAAAHTRRARSATLVGGAPERASGLRGGPASQGCAAPVTNSSSCLTKRRRTMPATKRSPGSRSAPSSEVAVYSRVRRKRVPPSASASS